MHKTEIKKPEESIVGNTDYTFCKYFTRGRKMKDKTTTIYKKAILNKATDVLQIFIKYIIVIISMLFLGFIFLQSFLDQRF